MYVCVYQGVPCKDYKDLPDYKLVGNAWRDFGEVTREHESWGDDLDSTESYTWDSKMAAVNVSTQGDHLTCVQSFNRDHGYVQPRLCQRL